MRFAPLLSVNVVEDEDGEVSYIGQLAGIESDALLLREVDPNAHWHADAGDYGFDEIASIGFGTGYLDALWQVAGTPTDPMSPRVPRLGFGALKAGMMRRLLNSGIRNELAAHAHPASL